jgi:BlaI family transcriptional regulator, penicillinase repressor
MAKPVTLSALQLSLMRVLWDLQVATTADVVQAVRKQRDIAHTTVATMLTRLERAGLVTAQRDGKHLSYRPRAAESDIQQSMVSGLLANLFDGRPTALISHLLKRDEIDAKDLEQIRQLLKKHRVRHE